MFVYEIRAKYASKTSFFCICEDFVVNVKKVLIWERAHNNFLNVIAISRFINILFSTYDKFDDPCTACPLTTRTIQADS